MIVYNVNTGDVVGRVPDSQNIPSFYYHYPQKFKDSLRGIIVDSEPDDLINYKVTNGVLVKKSDTEIEDMLIYGKILTTEERLLNQLKPSDEEISNAKNTIEILTLLSEVL